MKYLTPPSNFLRATSRLKSAFAKFVDAVDHAIQEQSFYVEGLSVSDRSPTFLEFGFAGHRYKIFFSSVLGDDGLLKGLLRCFAVKIVPDEKLVEIGSLRFRPNGQTVDNFLEEGEPLDLTVSTDAVLFVLKCVTDDLTE